MHSATISATYRCGACGAHAPTHLPLLRRAHNSTSCIHVHCCVPFRPCLPQLKGLRSGTPQDHRMNTPHTSAHGVETHAKTFSSTFCEGRQRTVRARASYHASSTAVYTAFRQQACVSQTTASGEARIGTKARRLFGLFRGKHHPHLYEQEEDWRSAQATDD